MPGGHDRQNPQEQDRRNEHGVVSHPSEVFSEARALGEGARLTQLNRSLTVAARNARSRRILRHYNSLL